MPLWRRVLAQLREPLVVLLLIAVVILMIAWFAEPAVALVGALQVAVVHVPFRSVAFGTQPLRAEQWLVCVGVASAVLWVSEVRKLVGRWVARVRAEPSASAPPA